MSQTNLDTITELYKAFENRDLDAILALFDPAIEITQTDALPWGGSYHGHAGAGTFLQTLLAHVDSAVTTERMFAAGDHVVEIGRTSGRTVTGGVPFDVAEVHVWRLRDGKIVAYDAYLDTPAMLAALAPR
jgi:ketosteroid isomerase-like protein